jgi:error-prone DNA polymerase
VRFVHLHVHSAFSWLAGADGAGALAARAAALGQEALALTDTDTLAGAVPFLQACARHGLRAILGAEVTLAGGGRLVLLAPDAGGYAGLCRLLSRAHLDHPRGRPAVEPEVLAQEAPRLLALSGGRDGDVPRLLLGRRPQEALQRARFLAGLFGRERLFLELPADRLPGNRRLLAGLRELGAHLGLRTVAAGDVYYAEKGRAWVADLLCCVRLGCRVDDLVAERAAGAFNGERHLKPAAEVAAAVGDPEAAAAAAEVAAACRTPLQLGRSRHPRFDVEGGLPAAEALRRAVEEGAVRRYGEAGVVAVRPRLEHELRIIAGLGFADYFLCVADVVAFARAHGIRVAGRGSAADSAVAYVLGITDVDAAGRGHLFERFLSEERAEAPDIDLDFDSRRRDEVAAYVVRRYGRERVCAVGAHSTFEARRAVRDLGRALGFPPAELDALAKRIPYYVGAGELREALERVPELRGLPPASRSRLPVLCRGVEAVAGLPRHPGTHLGGLCITPGPVSDVMPVQRAAKPEWRRRGCSSWTCCRCARSGPSTTPCASRRSGGRPWTTDASRRTTPPPSPACAAGPRSGSSSWRAPRSRPCRCASGPRAWRT